MSNNKDERKNKEISLEFESKFNHAMDTLRVKEDLNSALREFRILAEQYPDRPAIYGMMGHVLWELGELEKAMLCFRKVTELNPHSELGSLGLFHLLWELERFDEAFTEMRRYMSIADSEEYKTLLKGILDELKEQEETTSEE